MKIRRQSIITVLILSVMLLLGGCGDAVNDKANLSDNDANVTTEQTTKVDATESAKDSKDSTLVDAEHSKQIEEDTNVAYIEQALIASVNSDGAGNNIPAYSGSPYIIVNNNVPFFDATQYNSQAFETYSELDTLGRCGVAFANVGKEIMPTGERGSIGSVKPTGWHTVKYDNVDGKYLYNRCHLIGYQLSGENANKQNLITGTRYMNVDGMLPFENMVADYVKETNNHVLYRVTPVFDGNNLVAGGVLMEAQSIEDDGSGVKFCVYCYNIQPGISIDYATGDSKVGDPVSAQADIGVAVADAGASANVPQTEAPTVAPTQPQTQAPTQPQTEAPTVAPTQPQTQAPTVAPTQPQDTGNSTLVWLSETGEKYHSINNCGRMNPDKAYQVTQEQAEAMGKGRCSKCW